MMPVCCTCNKRGRCSTCACVKNGKKCSNCQPSKKGTCLNSQQDSRSYPEDDYVEPEMIPVSEQTPQTNEEEADILPSLRPFKKMTDDTYMWNGLVDGDTFQSSVNSAYSEVVKWKRNIFLVPFGKTGERFVDELSMLFRAYGESTALEPIAITAAMTMPALLLQKPHPRSKTKDHVKCLERRLEDWKQGNISDLLLEGRSMQQRIRSERKYQNDDNAITKRF